MLPQLPSSALRRGFGVSLCFAVQFCEVLVVLVGVVQVTESGHHEQMRIDSQLV